MSDDLPLPDDLWRKILDLGIKNTELTYKDLCSISTTCKRLNQLSGEDSLWSHLLSNDFPRRIPFSLSLWYPFWFDPLPSVSVEEIANQPSSSSAKSQYRIRLEIDRERERELKARRRAYFAKLKQQLQRCRERFEAHRRAVQQKENDLFHIFSARAPVQRRAMLQEGNDLFGILSTKIQEIELIEEKQTRKATAADLFISTKANSKGFERVPNRCYPRAEKIMNWIGQQYLKHYQVDSRVNRLIQNLISQANSSGFECVPDRPYTKDCVSLQD